MFKSCAFVIENYINFVQNPEIHVHTKIMKHTKDAFSVLYTSSLVEEFMLLANMAVAHRINNFYPDKALLRRHPPPQEKMLENLVSMHSGRSCSKLTVSLVNDSLKFTSTDTQIC